MRRPARASLFPRASVAPGLRRTGPGRSAGESREAAPEDEPASGSSGSLRELAIRSAGYLAGRELLGMVVRLGGAVVTMREIGPSGYGIFTAAAAFALFASAVAQMGTEVYLIRAEAPPTRRRYDEAFTFLVASSLLVTAVGLVATVPLGGLLRPVGILLPLRVLLLVIPLNVLWAPAQACIERKFGYREMGILELGGDVVLYATAVPLAVVGWGPWSLVVGYFAWQGWLFFGSLAFSGLRPRLTWSWSAVREMLGHGSGYSLSSWATSGPQLVVALVVGTFAGAAGVGYVNFASRLVGMLNFTKRGVFRVGMVTVSRARRGGSDRLARALEEGSFLLMVAAAAPFAAFGLVARWIIPLVFGSSWVPAVPLFVVMAMASVFGVPILVQRTILQSAGKNLDVASAATVQLVVLAAASLVLVPATGVVGYGYASLLALVSTVWSHRSASRVTPMRYRRLLLPLAALVPPILAPVLPFPDALVTVVPTLLLLALPATRRELWLLVDVVRTTLAGRRSRSVPGGGTAPSAVRSVAAGAAGSVPVAVPASPAVAVTGSPVTDSPVTSTFPPAVPDRSVAAVAGPGGWLLPPDAVTGAASLEVMLARAGRLLGGARRSGWPVMLATFVLAPGVHGEPVGGPTMRAVVDALRGDLRFDDPIARAEPSTFVVATALAPGAARGPEVATRLASSVAGALARPRGEAAPTMEWSYVETAASSAEEVDDLLRRALGELHEA
ncbi:MAG: oligosaccharide flippase family protein [Acidimicrobiales bacterium]